MKQLIKQVLSSFKHSILLILSLIFVTSIIIFSAFSSLYLATNIYNSKNHLNVAGNKSDSIVEENYKESDIKYNYQTDVSGNIVTSTPTSVYKIDKEKAILDGYNESQYAVVFPYTSDEVNFTYNFHGSKQPISFYSFKHPSLNGENPYAYRSPGMVAGYGGNEYTGETVNITNNFHEWIAVAYGFKNNGSQRTNFDYLIIDQDTQRVSGYYDEGFTNNIPVMRGVFRAKQPTFNQRSDLTTNQSQNKFLNNVEVYSGVINAAFLGTLHTDSIPISNNVNMDILDTDIARDLIYYLNSLVVAVPKNELSNYTEINLSLDINSLTPFQNKIFFDDRYFSQKEREKYTNYKIVYRNSWINNPSHSSTTLNDAKPDNAKIKEQSDKKLQDVISELTLLLNSKYSAALSDMINDLKINHSQQKSFVITDQKTSNKFIVAEKTSSNIDDIVYIEGTKLSNSKKYLDVNELFKAEYAPSGNGRKYLKNYIRFLQQSINASLAPTPGFVQKALDNLVSSFDNLTAVNDSYYNFVLGYYSSDLLFSNPESNIKFDRQGQSIDYELKHGLTDIYLLSTIANVDKYAYAAVLSEGYLNSNNKKILPPNLWKDALKLSPFEFVNWVNKLDESYCIEINAKKFVIIATGLSPEMAFPSISYESPIPNTNTEAVVYVNKLGYDAILSTAPLSYQYKYFSLDLGFQNNSKSMIYILNSKDKTLEEKINQLNNYFKPILNPSSSKPIVYSLDDYETMGNLITMRSYFPNQILYGVIIISIVVILILVALGLYLSYLLIKGYITKNQVQLAIIKANGFSTLSLTLSISLFGLICSIIAGALGYVLAYFLQTIFYQIINPYWYAPVALLNFSPIGFIGGIITLLAVFVIFTFIITRLTFRKSINELITQNVEMKSSKLLNLLRRPNKKTNPLFKFRLALSFSNIWRAMFFTALCSIGLSSITIGLTIPQKFINSNQQTSLNKHYAYKFGLTETTEQSGLYKLQEYSNLGFTDLSQGIYPLYEGSMSVAYEYDDQGKPIYSEDDSKKIKYNFGNPTNYPYKLDELKVYTIKTDSQGNGSLVEKRDKFGNMLYFGNILVPSYSAYSKINNMPDFYNNSVLTKWLLDFTIPGLNINPWQLIRRLVPNEIVVRAETQDQIFLKAVYENQELAKLKNIGLDPQSFINYENNLYSINANSILGNLGKPEEIGYSKNFLKFIGVVYGIEELSRLDVKLSFGIIPYDSSSETYSSVNSSMYRGTNLLADNIDLLGINLDSKYVTLVDDKKRNLNKLLAHNENDSVYNLVVNQGAAYKYGFKVDDILSFSPNKGYFYYSQKVANDFSKNNQHYDFNKKYNFKIVGISTASYGDEFYVSQDVANIVNQSAMNFDKPELGGRFKANRPFAFNTNNVEQTFIGPNYNQEVRIDGALVNDQANKAQYELAYNNRFTDFYRYEYKPFNGIISDSNSPLFLSKTIAFQSILGVWNQLDYSSTEKLSRHFSDYYYITNPALSWQSKMYFDNMATANTEILKAVGWDITATVRKDFRNAIMDKNQTNNLFAQYIRDVFGNYPVSLNINTIEAYATVQYLYGNLVSTINLVQTLSTIILIPLIIVMILVISASMLEEFKRMIIVLKTIGYSDKDNILSILTTFIPIVLLTLVIGLGIVIGILYLFQFIIYTASTVFITHFVNWITYAIGIGVVVGVLLINFVAMTIMYKQQKLKFAIVD